MQKKYKEYRCENPKKKNGGLISSPKCIVCGSKKSRFMKEQEADIRF